MTVAPTKQEREAREARDRLKKYTARQEVHRHQAKRRVRDNIIAVASIVVVVGLAAVTQVVYFTAGPGAPAPAASDEAAADPEASDAPAEGENVGEVPDPATAEDRVWTGALTLNEVELGIELDGALAPQAVSAFIDGVDSQYYPGKTCHRLVESASARLIQCGSADGTGATDPSFSFGPIENAPEDEVYPAGTIAMARAGGDAYSNGRQFFITLSDTTLPSDEAGGYTVMGSVTSGLDGLIGGIADGGIVDDAADGAPVVPTTITALTLE